MASSRARVAILLGTVAALVAGLVLAVPAGATPTRTVRYVIPQRVCAAATRPHQATCFAIRLKQVPKGTRGAKAYVQKAPSYPFGPAGGYTPGDLATAYGVNPAGGANQTVAIVDWYGDPNIRSDLNTFDANYGLPAETSTSFRVVNQNGAASPLPPPPGAGDVNTSTEIALDVESVRGMCHRCKILLILANSPYNSDLAAAENTAASMGATEISNSFGEPEVGTDPNFQAAFNHPGIVITASTGDDGWYGWDIANDRLGSASQPNIPAAYPTVTAVAGTSLALNPDGTRQSETVWNGNGPDDEHGFTFYVSLGASGGGCSLTFGAPRWQAALPGFAAEGCNGKRQTGDVAADADPSPGFGIYNSADGTGWETVGGTSLSSPLVAAMWALAGGAGGIAYPAQSLYLNSQAHPASAHDVTSGGNAFCGGDSLSNCSAVLKGETSPPTGNPNGIGLGVLDCGYPYNGGAGTLANRRQCNAGSGYDGPSGVGTPNGLGVFAPVPNGGVISLAPSRLLDTRTSHPVAARGTLRLPVTGRGGVPGSNVSAVVLNVTVTAPTAGGYITAYADGATRPTASNLNFARGETVPNLVLAPVGADGAVDLYNGSAGTTHLVADVSGYVVSGTPLVAGGLGSVAPARLLDTRTTSALSPTETAALQVDGRGGVPASGVSAVVLNVTVVGPTAGGFITAYPDGTTQPTASNLNFRRGQTVPNLVVAPVGADGKVDLYNGSAGDTQLIADVAGYFITGSSTQQGTFAPVGPARILDTRTGSPVGAAATAALTVTGQGGVPSSGVSAVILNVTVTQPQRGGFLTVWADGAPQPFASNLNFVAGQTVPNLVLAPVGPDGKVDIYNGSSGTTHVVVDVSGYVRDGT